VESSENSNIDGSDDLLPDINTKSLEDVYILLHRYILAGKYTIVDDKALDKLNGNLIYLLEDFMLYIFFAHNNILKRNSLMPIISIPEIENDKKIKIIVKKSSFKELTRLISPEAEKSTKWSFIEKAEVDRTILEIESSKIIEIKRTLSNTNLEINHYGAVYTSDILVDKMLDKLEIIYKNINNEDLFSNKDIKICDPSSGSGSFLLCCKHRLINQLSEANEEHIVNSMLFGSEIQKKQKLISEKILNFKDKKNINPNINLGDSLNFNFWGKKFDVVIGNPPYQETSENGNRKAKNHNLWELFVLKGLELVKDDGFLVYIIPTSWMSPAWKYSESTFRKYKLHYLEVNTIQEYFPGVGSQFCWFILQKKSYDGCNTNIVSRYGGKEYTIDEKMENIPFMSQLLSKESISIIRKFYLSKHVSRFNMKADSSLHTSNKKEKLSKEMDLKYRFPIKHTNVRVLYSYEPHENQYVKKVLLSKSGKPIAEYDNKTFGTTEAMMYTQVRNDKEGKNIEFLLNSKAYQFIFSICKWSGFNIQKVFYNIPYYDLASFTDEEIYKCLKLTKKEIKLIEEVVR
jgi:adenine-specific DNA-methyltransferase